MTGRLTRCAIALVASGCHIEAEPAANEPPPTTPVEAAQARVHERFASARQIEQAVVNSDLARARVEAHALTLPAESDVSSRWRPYLDRISAAADEIERAPDVVVAARATAALGRECAGCHQATAVTVPFPSEPRPPEGSTLQPQMLGHQWAAAQMWEGLIGPADERWTDGARALTQVALTIVAEEPRTVMLRDWTPSDGDSIGDDIARVRVYAKRAVTTYDQDARTEVFGDLLATCAHCHAAIRDR